MSARDTIHDAVVRALQKDGWTITEDPLTLEFGDTYLFVDVGAERTVSAERAEEKIAVEVKSFGSKSKVTDLQQALGQFLLYRSILSRVEPERALYLAVSSDTYDQAFDKPVGHAVREDTGLQLVVVNLISEEVVSWIT